METRGEGEGIFAFSRWSAREIAIERLILESDNRAANLKPMGVTSCPV